MAKLPITFQKVKIKDYQGVEQIRYLVVVSEKGTYWNKTTICDMDDLFKLREELDKVLKDLTTAELLNITEDKARRVEQAHANDILCKSCAYKMTADCVTCLFELQSPLERKLFLALKKAGIYFRHQYGIDWRGNNIFVQNKAYGDPENNFKDVLTIVDFFVSYSNKKLCVYTDGHTYHERTEEQATHDRTIDRKLQSFGFTVHRYTGKEVNDNISKIIDDINN